MQGVHGELWCCLDHQVMKIIYTKLCVSFHSCFNVVVLSSSM
jgi:hypothetical protein